MVGEGKGGAQTLDNLRLDVGRNSPPLWCISEMHHPHGSGWHPNP
jgi:hypothetical protein